MMKRSEADFSPQLELRRRLGKNKPAVFGLSLIVLAVLIAVLGYLIMPDSTRYANDGAVQLRKQPPGFQANLLLFQKNSTENAENWLSLMLFGRESNYLLIPFERYHIEGFEVMVVPAGRSDKEITYNLIDLVLPLGSGKHLSAAENQNKNFKIEGNKVIYERPDGSINSIEYQELLERFRNEHVEQRKYWLGTDEAGRDLLSRLIYGTRISLAIGLIAVLISMFLGLLLGAMAGFFRGNTDRFILWFMSVIWSIPGIMLVIAISIALQSRGVWVAFLAVGLTMWVDVARVVRGQILSIREKQYIEAARAFGINNRRIIFVHVMPNILGPLVVIATANFASAILLEAGLSFLGLSVQPPVPSWGNMILAGYHAIGTRNSWHLILFPGLAISMLVLSFNLLGNGLRDALDPQNA